MIPVDQTILSSESDKGNCLAACVASILEVPLETVPNFIEETSWFSSLRKFLLQHGYHLFELTPNYSLPVFHLMIGPGPRSRDGKPIHHSVVGKGGVIVHDPHPSKSGLLEVEYFLVFLPVDQTSRHREFTPFQSGL